MKPLDSGQTKKLADLRICVVEDDEFFQGLLHKKLTESGATVTSAENGSQGLELTAEGGYDLIILDLILPGIDGFEFLRRRKTNPKAAAIPVMVLSNLNDQNQVADAKGLGVNAYLVKAAVSIAEIVDEAAKVVSQHKPR